MKPIYLFIIACILSASCSFRNKNSEWSLIPKSDLTVASQNIDRNRKFQFTPNPIIIPESPEVFSDTSYVELSAKTREIKLKKIGEVQWPGKQFLSGVKEDTYNCINRKCASDRSG